MTAQIHHHTVTRCTKVDKNERYIILTDAQLMNWISQSYPSTLHLDLMRQSFLFLIVDLVTEKPSTLRRCTEET
jgi:hypothetical protein